MQWPLILGAASVALYVAALLALVVAGRGADARALAGFIPDCLVLFKRMLSDPRISWWRRAMLAGLIAYLALPIDLVPDLIPVIGQLGDAIIVALVLRTVLRASGELLLVEHWPGPDQFLRVMRRLVYGT